MKFSELRESKYLKKEDVDPAVLVTIDSFKQENVAREGSDPQMKWVMFLKEYEKGVVMNTTNGQILTQIFGTDEADEVVGEKIVLYLDPNVRDLTGKLVGGIRIRGPKGTMKPSLKPHKGNNRPVMENEDEDSIPF
jgi:hypothetical protein